MRKKNIALTLSALALTAVVTVGGTLAYLSDVTETKQNVFTGTSNITGHLEEKDWNQDQGSKYTPGQVLAKTPLLTLNKGSVKSYAALVVSCTDNDSKSISVESFENGYGDLMYNKTSDLNTEWKHIGYKANVGDVYVLTDTNGDPKVLDATSGDVTAPALFDSVKINVGIKEVWTKGTELTKYYFINEKGEKIFLKADSVVSESTAYFDEKGNKVDIATLPSFNINVTGYMTQATDVSTSTGLTNLLDLTGYNK